MILWKHKDMKDVAFEILKKYYIKEKDIYEVKVEYWLRLPETQLYEPMHIKEKLRLPSSKVREWRIV